MMLILPQIQVFPLPHGLVPSLVLLKRDHLVDNRLLHLLDVIQSPSHLILSILRLQYQRVEYFNRKICIPLLLRRPHPTAIFTMILSHPVQFVMQFRPLLIRALIPAASDTHAIIGILLLEWTPTAL